MHLFIICKIHANIVIYFINSRNDKTRFALLTCLVQTQKIFKDICGKCGVYLSAFASLIGKQMKIFSIKNKNKEMEFILQIVVYFHPTRLVLITAEKPKKC